MQNRRFSRQEEGETRKLRVDCFRQGLLPLGESSSSVADYLTSADEEIPTDWLQSPLPGTLKLQFS